jgi:hypothetical protein
MARKPTSVELETATPRGRKYDDRVGSVLGTNTKMEKLPNGREVINSGVTMAPSKRSKIVNVCEWASAACIATCVLWFAGRRAAQKMRECAQNITALWFYWPERFYARYDRELSNQERRADAAGVESYNRPNVASDLNHDRIVCKHPRTTFYDYTAGFSRMVEYLSGKLPPNYFLTFSVKESTPYDHVEYVIRNGGNVAVVVDTYYWGPTKRYGMMPRTATFQTPDGSRSFTIPVIDGDRHDIRTPEFDGHGRMIGLRLKALSGKVKELARTRGFAKYFSRGGKEYSRRFDMVQGGTIVITLPALQPLAIAGGCAGCAGGCAVRS